MIIVAQRGYSAAVALGSKERQNLRAAKACFRILWQVPNTT
jgi:hypothetical protein